jgi:hypothetical protein
MAIVNTTNFPSPTQIAWSEKLLAIKVPMLIHGTLAMQKKMPSNSGYILRMSRTNRLADALVPLGPSGVTPPPSTMSRVDIDSKPEFYGDYIILNEQCTLLNTDPEQNGVYKLSLIDLDAYGIC